MIGCTTIFGCTDSHTLRPVANAVTSASPCVRKVATTRQGAEIAALIEQLVFTSNQATNQPVYSPGVTDKTADYRQRFTRCQQAFKKLSELKDLAFPLLVEHLDDKRQSINFCNHVLANSVGYACYLIICNQLQDLPENYSEYGWQREGQDGQNHPKPYWVGTPFDDASGLKNWLTVNKGLAYPKMQVKCLQWLLEKEKAIGACDAESFFLNILPLEVRILERRQEAGENVGDELRRLRSVLVKKDAKAVPVGLLPEKR